MWMLFGFSTLWCLFACQGESKKEAPSVSKSKVPSSSEKIPAVQELGEHHSAPSSKAPIPKPADKSIDSSGQTVKHPPTLDAKQHQTIDVCAPYYRLVALENKRGKGALDAERVASLRSLNRLLDYHPEHTATALVELEKEALDGPIHLSIEKRREYWKGIHLYIGGICRVDLSGIR